MALHNPKADGLGVDNIGMHNRKAKAEDQMVARGGHQQYVIPRSGKWTQDKKKIPSVGIG
jgi:hypothetical protein